MQPVVMANSMATRMAPAPLCNQKPTHPIDHSSRVVCSTGEEPLDLLREKGRGTMAPPQLSLGESYPRPIWWRAATQRQNATWVPMKKMVASFSFAFFKAASSSW